MRLLGPILVFALTAAVFACSSSDDDSKKSQTSTTKCVPGQTLRCLCGLDEGTYTCSDTGTFTECQCRTPDPDPDPDPEFDAGTEPDSSQPARCGNGTVEDGEACDDNNTADGDGCSADCVPDGIPLAAEKCPGQVATLWPGKPLELEGTTVGFQGDFITKCNSPSVGPDRVYAIKPKKSGNLKISGTFEKDFGAIIEIREATCDQVAASVLCADTFGRPFSNVVEVKADKTYFLIVDSWKETVAGVYTIRLEL